MRRLDLHLAKDERPAYLRIAEAIRGAVKRGQLSPGELLPSTRALAETCGVHRHTIMTALDELMAEGWIVGEQRRAYRVHDELPSQFFKARAPDARTTVKPHAWRLAREANAVSLASERGAKIAFQSGLPDAREFPFKEFGGHFADAMKAAGPKLFAKLGPSGYEPLLVELEGYLRRVRGVIGREIIVTHGSQEALFLAAQLLAGKGDIVAVEALGYQPAWRAFEAAGARLRPVPIDAEGIDPDGFERLCRKTRPRFLYLTPLHQYPTTVTLSVIRRLRIYEIAAHHGVPIVEDDYDHEYHYRSQPLAPFAASDPAGLVVYVSTFTKVMYPSIRLGYLAVPRELGSAVARYRQITSSQNDVIQQHAVARWMRDGGFERHMRRMRKVYQSRLAALEDELNKAVEDGASWSWQQPAGGMALWLELARGRSQAVARRARKLGVFVHAEEEFQFSPSHGHALRLGFASLTPAEIAAGVKLLAQAL